MIASNTAENTFFSLEPTSAFLIILMKPTGGWVAILDWPAINNTNKIMDSVTTYKIFQGMSAQLFMGCVLFKKYC